MTGTTGFAGQLIGLHGAIGAGKDTVASRLKEAHGFWGLSFAGPVKDMLINGLGLPREAFTDRNLKEDIIPWLGKSPRDLMRSLGTEWGRGLVSEDIWVNKCSLSIGLVRHAMRDRAAIVVTDVRYPNEADFIRSRGGKVWHIARQQQDRIEHTSDIKLIPKPGDSIVSNNGTLQDLHAEIERALLGHCVVQP